MKIKLFVTVVLFFFCAAGLHAQKKAAPKISAIRAQLFYDASGTFSKDILSVKDFALWNTIIGEGDAEEPSTSTLVTVEISGRDVPLDTLKIEITATGRNSRLIQKRLFDVDLYDAREKFYAPLLLNNTGCEEIKISARLVGKSASAASAAPVVKKIPFACGE